MQKTIKFCNSFDSIIPPGEMSDLKNADIICTATTSKTPLFNFEDIKAGVHINAIGAHQADTRELDTSLIQKSKVYIDQLSSSQIEAGDLIIPINEGKYNWNNVEGELGELIDEKIAGRTSEDEITIFNSIGNAVQDLVIASMVFEKNQT